METLTQERSVDEGTHGMQSHLERLFESNTAINDTFVYPQALGYRSSARTYHNRNKMTCLPAMQIWKKTNVFKS